MSIIYLGAAWILAVQAAQYSKVTVVLNLGPYYNEKVKQYDRTKSYTMEQLDDMFTIFHNLSTVLNTLKKPQYSQLVEVKELLKIFEDKKAEIKRRDSEAGERNTKLHPFIVVDGFEGSGKNTIVDRLDETIGCFTVHTPPGYLKQLRIGFDSLNFELRSAFYSLVNYLIAYHTTSLRRHTPILAYRYWHSQMAYTLAHQYELFGVFPDMDSIIYNWPDDLLKPDVIYVLDRTRKVRIISMQTFHKMLHVYRSMKTPEVVILSDQVATTYLEVMFGHLLIDMQRRFNFTVLSRLWSHNVER